MSCDNYRPFIGAYIDDELDERDSAEFEAHIDSCSECREEFEQQLEFKQNFQRALCGESAPEELKEEILAGMSQIDAEREAERSGSRSAMVKALAAGVPLTLGAAVVLWFVPLFTVAPVESGQPPIVEQTVDWHQESLPVEVKGPDRSHVGQWFRGKVEFPVRLPDFAKAGAELLGGRIAHMRDRRAAYLAYEVNGARMSVMMFHADALKIPTDRVRNVASRDIALFNNHGFEVAVLQDGGITYTITSDLTEKELVDVVGSSIQASSHSHARAAE